MLKYILFYCAVSLSAEYKISNAKWKQCEIKQRNTCFEVRAPIILKSIFSNNLYLSKPYLYVYKNKNLVFYLESENATYFTATDKWYFKLNKSKYFYFDPKMSILNK